MESPALWTPFTHIPGRLRVHPLCGSDPGSHDPMPFSLSAPWAALVCDLLSAFACLSGPWQFWRRADRVSWGMSLHQGSCGWSCGSGAETHRGAAPICSRGSKKAVPSSPMVWPWSPGQGRLPLVPSSLKEAITVCSSLQELDSLPSFCFSPASFEGYFCMGGLPVFPCLFMYLFSHLLLPIWSQ